jgi:hypothetical protein
MKKMKTFKKNYNKDKVHVAFPRQLETKVLMNNIMKRRKANQENVLAFSPRL